MIEVTVNLHVAIFISFSQYIAISYAIIYSAYEQRKLDRSNENKNKRENMLRWHLSIVI